MASYEEDFKSFQHLDTDIKLYERLLTDLEYKNKLTRAFNISEDLKISDEKIYVIYNVVIKDLQQVSFEDLKSFKRLQNQKRLKYVIEMYEQKLQDNLVYISHIKKK